MINTRALDIAKREAANRDRMCLYSTGTYWVAFEHSAYFLSRLFPDLESMMLNHPSYPFPIIAFSVPADMFLDYKTKHEAIRRKEDYIEYKVNSLKLQDYGTWHQQMVEEYRDVMMG